MFIALPAIANSSDFNNLLFKNIAFKDELPFQRSCNSILQDTNGFIWFGSDVGMHRFDGSSFKNFYCNKGIDGSLSGTFVGAMMNESDGNILVATSTGIDRFTQKSEKIESIPIFNAKNESLKHRKPFLGFFSDSKGAIYAYTHVNFYKLSSDGSAFHRINPNFSVNIEYGNKNTILQNDSVIWVATQKGLLRTFIDRPESRLFHIGENFNSIAVEDILLLSNDTLLIGTIEGLKTIIIDSNYNVSNIEIDNSTKGLRISSFAKNGNSIWLATDGGGVINYMPKTKSAKRYLHDHNNDYSIINNKILQVYIDRQKNLWLFSQGNGISITNLEYDFLFRSLTSKQEFGEGLSHNIVTSFEQDGSGTLLIGTDGGGLNLFDKEKMEFEHVVISNYKSSVRLSNSIISILKKSDFEFWVAVYNEGIFLFNSETKKFKKLDNIGKNIGLSGYDFSALATDDNDNLFILTHGNGLNVYSPDKRRLEHLKDDVVIDAILAKKGGRALYKDNDGAIWVGTYYGLYRIKPGQEKTDEFFHRASDSTTLSNNNINCVYQDSKGFLWVGTNNGVNQINLENFKIKRFNVEDGLIYPAVNTIVEDDEGYIWIGTNKGLSKLDLEKNTFENHYNDFGMSGNYFVRNASFNDSNGNIYFGTTQGFTFINSNRRIQQKMQRELLITDFLIFDKSVKVGQKFNNKTILEKSILNTDKIKISYKENNFALQFSTLEFIDPGKYNFFFKMAGFDKGWRKKETNDLTVSYTSLAPGKYEFLVHAKDNLTGEVVARKVIAIEILPPWWETWWAFLIYLILILVLINLYRNILKSRMEIKQDLYLEKIEREKEMESNQMKINFFTNITHEFRTPLTLIIGPIEDIIKQYTKDNFLLDHAGAIKKNAHRLLKLINELLDLRKMEEASMELSVSENNIVQFVEEVGNLFKIHSEIHDIDFIFETNNKKINVWFDRNKFEKVIYNVLSNAFKFTPDTGSIKCVISKSNIDDTEYVEISVIDSGIGIKAEDITELYKRYYTSSSVTSYHSTGIGLSLSKEILELHHGYINATNNPDKGACFTIGLPLGKTHYEENQIAKDIDPDFIEKISVLSEKVDKLDDANDESDKKVLLIVEDNHDVRKYIKNDFIGEYVIIEADNGKSGYDMALERIPDIIISDIMMPGISGVDLCRSLKENEVTSHIPIILLTALAGVDNRIVGVESGADAYISKPFHPLHLKTRVKKLIELRNILKEKFGQQIHSKNFTENLTPKEIEKASVDETFLKNAVAIIENNISDSDFEIDDLCKELGMNYLQLYRKIKALTDLSIKNFIITIRLKAATALIEKEKFTISEICFDVGFTSPAYFTKCFKKAYGVTPTQYLSDSKNKD